MWNLFWHVAAPAFCLLWLTKNAVESFQLSAPEVVTAEYGGSVTIFCHYHQIYREKTKYWCKGKIYYLCSIQVKTPRNRWNKRSFIKDDKDAGYFNITMTSLSYSDEDKYWCVIAQRGKNIYTGVWLHILHPVTTSIPPTTLSPTTQSEICWWAVLRWILFILLLCCLASTHIVARRMQNSHTKKFNIRT